LEGFLKALSQLDAIIKLIRASKTPLKRARVNRELEFYRSPGAGHPGNAVAAPHPLSSATKIQAEFGELQKKIAEYQEILASEKVLKKVIATELKEIQKVYGDSRRTEIIEQQDEIRLEDLIADQDVIITISHSGYTKRTPLSTYRQQARGGKGRLGMKTRDEDFVENLFIASTHSYILVFTNTGKLYWLKVYEIPDVGAPARASTF